MNRALIILMFSAMLVHAEDGLYVMDTRKKPRACIDGNELVMRAALRKIAAPKAKSVILLDSAASSAGAYTIQVDLEESPEEGWMPIIALGEAVLVEGVRVSHSERMGATLSFGTDSPQQATEFLARTAKIFGLGKQHVTDARTQKVKPESGANKSRPSRSETNSTSGAAGSRR